MGASDLLARAQEHCFLAGVGDVGEALCEANMPYGIAKIHHVQRALGLPADATFVGAPDATVTRNARRWKQGFGYGGRIRWTGDFAVLDIKSNGCGVLVGSLDRVPEREEIAARARKLIEEGFEVEGVHCEYDLAEGNHFLDVCETEGAVGGVTPDAPAYFVMHSSGHEHRKSSPFGAGIYVDESEALRARTQTYDTPWGTLTVALGDDATWFYGIYARVQRFNHARREAIARALFGDAWRVVVNATHQGLSAVNDAHLGCYVFDDADLARGVVFPLTIQAELPIHLVRPRPSLGERVARDAGLLARAEKHGIVDRILRANLLPHGGGYRYPGFAGVSRVIEDGPDARRFEMRTLDGGTEVVTSPREKAHGYRGEEILDRMRALSLGDSVVQMRVRYVLRD